MGLGFVAGLLACCVWLMKGVIEMASAVKRDGRAVVTTCGGCYADCAFAARVEDGRVAAELPVPGHPCAARALCARGRHRLAMPFDERDRILHPMRRRDDGSGFDAISWDEAFAQIAARFGEIVDERGPRSLGMTLGVPSFDRYWAHRFMHALGSPNVYGADGACEVSRLTGWEHSLGYSPASDLAHTDCIMYLGRSIVDSSTMEAVDALNDARRRGAKIIVVDPRRSGSAALADRWLRVRPGCDLALLLGIVHVLIAEDLYDHEFVTRYTTGFDELAQAAAAWTPEWAESMCDVPAAEIAATARDLAAAAPAAVVDAGFHGGIGIAYANSTQTARAICLVDVLLGCIGHAGGALNPPTPLVLGDLDPARFATPSVPRRPKLGSERYPLVDPVRGLCTTIGQSILAGDLRGLIVYASNPGVGTVVDANDARVFYRNAVLPVHHDDTRPGREIFAGLAQACGVGEYFQFTSDDLAAAQVAPFGVNLDELKERGWADTGITLPSRTGEPAIPLDGGKIALASDVWERADLGRVPNWIAPMVEPGPGMFRLISGNRPFESHTSRRLAAQGAAEAGSDLDAVQMNADAAAHMGIADGEIVELVSDMGRDRVRVETTPYLHPACIFTSAAPGGRSFGADAGGAQALGVGPLDHTPLRWDPLTGAALTQENAVRVEKITAREDNDE